MAKARNSRSDGERRRPVKDAVASPHLNHLSLPELRQYRSRLNDEEERVSYWRRLAHARIDVLQAESDSGGTLSMDKLIKALGDTGSGGSRKALVNVAAAEPLPDLPALTEMWGDGLDPEDPQQAAEALARVRAAERQLTDYRRALHARIDEATGELISRYREDPTRALDVFDSAQNRTD